MHCLFVTKQNQLHITYITSKRILFWHKINICVVVLFFSIWVFCAPVRDITRWCSLTVHVTHGGKVMWSQPSAWSISNCTPAQRTALLRCSNVNYIILMPRMLRLPLYMLKHHRILRCFAHSNALSVTHRIRWSCSNGQRCKDGTQMKRVWPSALNMCAEKRNLAGSKYSLLM